MKNPKLFAVMLLVVVAVACGGGGGGTGPSPLPSPSATAPTAPSVVTINLPSGMLVADAMELTTSLGSSFPAQTVYRPLQSCVEFVLGPGVPAVPAEVVDGLGEIGYGVLGVGSGCWVATMSMAAADAPYNGGTSPRFTNGVSMRGEIYLHPVYGLNDAGTWLHELGHAMFNLGHTSSRVDSFTNDPSSGQFKMSPSGSMRVHFNQTERFVISQYRTNQPGSKFRIAAQ